MTEWRKVEDYDGYLVNEDGEILSLPKVTYSGAKLRKKVYPAKIINGKKDRDGYLIMVFRNSEGVVKYPKKHRIVAKAFPEICGEWFEGCVVDHINGIRDDNRAINLRVCTVAQNNNNPITKERWSESVQNTNWGKGWSGHKHTEETKQKMREIKLKAHKGHFWAI